MDVAQIKAAAPQSIPTGVLTDIVLGTLVFEQGTSVDGNTSSSLISVTEAGMYLVTFQVQVIGTGQHFLYLVGNGFASPGTEVLQFAGDAAGVIHGRAVILRGDARALFRLQASHNGGAGRDYTCSLCVAKLAAS